MPIDVIAPVNNGLISPKATEQTLTYFTQLITEGVLWGLNCTAQTVPDLTVNLSAGFGVVNSSTPLFKYPFTTTGGIISFGAPPISGNSRIDLVVVKYVVNSGQITTPTIEVVEGTPATTGTQVAPILIETSALYYMVLAQVTITGASSAITTGQIAMTGNITNASNVNLQPLTGSTVFEIHADSRVPKEYLEVLATANYADSSITTAKIADANVTTAKILDANVTTAKLATNAVTTAKITDANVTTAKIADGAITQAKLDSGIGYIPTPRLKCTRMYAPTQGNVTAEGFTLSGISFTANNLTADGLYASVTQSGTGNRAFTQPNPITRLDYEPIVEFRIRTAGLTLGNSFAHWIGLFAVSTPSDRINSGGACVGFRSNDDGTNKEAWTPYCYNGTTPTAGTAMTAVTASTAYILRIRVVNVSGTYTAYFSVNGGTEQSINTNLPATSTGLYIVNGLSNQSGSAGGIIAELNSIYYEGK